MPVIGTVYDFMRSRNPLEAEELINGFAQYTRYIVACKAGTLDRETNYPRGVGQVFPELRISGHWTVSPACLARDSGCSDVT